MLTEHPLIFVDGKASNIRRGLHGIKNIRVADLSSVLYHYKPIDSFRERVARAAREENYAPQLHPLLQ